MKYVATVNDESRVVEVTGTEGRYRVTVGGDVWEVDARLTAQGIYSLLVDGVSYVADVTDGDGACVVEVGGEWYEITVEEQTRHIIRTHGGAPGGPRSRTLVAPLPGKISRVIVKPGDTVRAGDTLLVIEAMKMENEFKAAGPGTVAEVRVAAGQTVNAGDVLIVMA
jgi:acetyl/propionyl-CoA carboxylase alpha subunit